jgi:hypothetical protein
MARTAKGPTSDKVRQAYNWTWFGSLSLNEKFVFASDVDGSFGTRIGVCEKLTARKYKYAATVHGGTEVGIVAQVGSIHAIVVRLNGDGDPDKTGDYAPDLGD